MLVPNFLMLCRVFSCLLMLVVSVPALYAQSFRVVFIPKGATHAFWKEMARGVEEVARANSVELVWRGPAREDDVQAQSRLLELYRIRKFDGVILAPDSPVALDAQIRRTRAAGTRMLIVDSPLQQMAGMPLVATDNRYAGALIADQVVRDHPELRKVLILRFSSAHLSTHERENGFRERLLQLLPSVQVIDEHYVGISRMDSRNKALLVLRQHPDADVVFTPNESSTEGVIQAIQEGGLVGKVSHYGFDFSLRIHNALRDGYLQGVVMQDAYRMGQQSMRLMLDMLKGKKTKGTFYTPVMYLTAQTLQQASIQRRITPFLYHSKR